MRIDVVSIFPDYLAPLELSLIGTARREGLLDLRVHDLREATHDRHRTVDDSPYGGGAGMVMRPEPWGEMLSAITADSVGSTQRPTLVVPSPAGELLTQQTARELAGAPWLVFACGRYEGIDERVLEHAARSMDVRVLSLGDYVLNGGEVAALAMIEAVARLIAGVIGNPDSLTEESHEDGLLEYPVYTRPLTWEGLDVPAVLRSGDHGAVARWRHEQRLSRTAARRPDLLHSSASVNAQEMQLTVADPADVGELLTLTHACWLTEALVNRSFDIPAVHETYDSLRVSLGEWRTWVLRHDGRMVASVRGRTQGGEWEIGRLAVVPDLRGRGIGRWLLEHAERSAPADAMAYRLTTGADSMGNLRMYRRAGYRVVRGGAIPGAVQLRKPRR